MCNFVRRMEIVVLEVYNREHVSQVLRSTRDHLIGDVPTHIVTL